MFHLMTHAFFKALLFLAAGIVIHALTGEQDIRRMGGLGNALPFTRTVFLIVDNGSSHAGQASIDRLQGAYPNLRLIHLPIHASWLNSEDLSGCLAGV